MSALTTSRIARSAAVAVVTGGAVAGAVGLSAAAPATTTHTLKMVTTQIADHQVSGYDLAVNRDTVHGKTVGYDLTDCRINFNTHVAKCEVSVERADGVLRGKVSFSVDSGTGTGTVTGGTRAFRGATGTISAKSISQTKTLVTVSYHS